MRNILRLTVSILFYFVLISTVVYAEDLTRFVLSSSKQSEIQSPFENKIIPFSKAIEPKYHANRVLVKFRDGNFDTRTQIENYLKPTLNATVKRLFVRDESTLAAKNFLIEKSTKALKNKNFSPIASINGPEVLANWYILELPKDTNVQSVINQLKKDANVEAVEVDQTMKAASIPNDPMYPQLWAMPKIHADAAWDITQGEGVIIAEVDMGIDYNHPDLAASMWTNPEDGSHGWNFIDNNNMPLDDGSYGIAGHGTFVAGIMAATINNNIGVVGIAPKSKLMAIKALDTYGQGDVSNIANGIVYAAMNGAKVINNSWECPNGCESAHIPVLEDAIRVAYGMGVTIVVSAGNHESDTKNFNPQNMVETIKVADTDINDQRGLYSNYSDQMDVAAPGEHIFSTFRNNGYTVGDGTSFSAPLVSGLAALILSVHPNFTNEQVRQVIRMSADDILAPGWDKESGFGRINAIKALNIQDICTAQIQSITPVDGSNNTKFQINYSVTGQNFSSYKISKKGEGDSSWVDIYSSHAPILNGKTTLPLSASFIGTLIRVQGVGSNNQKCEDINMIRHPSVRFTYPLDKGYITNDTVDIRGKITGDNFSEYQLMVDNNIVLDHQKTPVNDGIIGQVNAAQLDPSVAHTLTLNVKTKQGTVITQKINVKVIPNNVHGWPMQLSSEFYGLLYPHFAVISPIVSDIDLDGKKDVVTAGLNNWPPYGTTVAINADGTLRSGWPAPLQGTIVSVGNVTGDAKLETVVVSIPDWNLPIHLASLYVLDQQGHVLPGWPKDLGTSPFFSSLMVTDLDKSGLSKIIVGKIRSPSQGTEEIDVFNGDGTMAQGWPKVLTTLTGSVNLVLAVGDILGDGNKEIISADKNSPYDPPPQEIIRIFDAYGNQLNTITFEGNLQTQIVLGDIDHDGHKEIIFGAHTSPGVAKIYVLRPDGSSLPGFPVQLPNNLKYPSGIALGDFDGNGMLGIVIQTRDISSNSSRNALIVFDHNGQIRSGWPFIWPTQPKAYGGTRLAVGDINGDGRTDILALQDYTNSVGLYAWDDHGTVLSGFPLSLGSQYAPWGPSLTDLNNDRKIDILLSDANGEIWAYSPFKANFDPRKIYWPQDGFDAGHTYDFELPSKIKPIARKQNCHGSNC